MFNSYRAKLIGAFLVVIALLLILLGGLGYNTYKRSYLDNMQTRLIQEARLVSDMTRFRTGAGAVPRSYQEICDTAARDSDTRVTIIDAGGMVLGDSQVEPSALDNHSSRPEVFSALRGQTGVDIRYSDTLAMNMLYVAVPFSDAENSGAVRLALPLAELQAIYDNALTAILLAALLCGLIATGLGLYLAQRFSHPLQETTRAVRDMAGGNLRRRISIHTGDEMEELARAFNDMGQRVQHNMDEITEVRNYLQAILDNTVNGILMIGAGDRVVYANPVAASLLALGQDFTNRKYVEIVSVYDLLAMIDAARATRRSVRDSLVLHALGARMLEVNVVPIDASDPARPDILVVMNDITEMKHLEQVRKDFVANVSHELKTPVASISGFAETLLAEGGHNPATVTEFARIIYQESQRLARMISDLLELSKLEADAFKLELETIDMDKLVEEAVNRMSTSAGFKDIEVDYRHPGHPLLLTSDPDMLDMIVTNLLDNAVNYSPEGGHITISLQDQGDRVMLSVQDNGIGIPARDLTRIFERFYRVDKARSRKTGGTGLGLSIVKHGVENLQGQVTVESVEGGGSTFYVHLPKLDGQQKVEV